MHNAESLRLGMRGLLGNKLRTLLTMLGIIFGVGAVISMLSISEGAKEETIQQIELLGTNNIIINKEIVEASNDKSSAFSPGLSMDDVKSILEINPYVESVTPQIDIEKQIVYKSKIEKFNIIGTTVNYPETFNSKIMTGRFFKEFHIKQYSNVCVIGYGVKSNLFKFEEALNKKIKIGDEWFEIIGIVAPKNISSVGEQTFGIKNFNNDIYVPITTLQAKVGFTNEEKKLRTVNRRGRNVSSGRGDEAEVVDRKSLDKITIKITNSNNLKEASFLTESILNRRHYGVKDYKIVMPEELLEQKQKTQRIFNIVMGAIAGISLIVGGIGIMNIMLANILERTREIGIRRAVGATKMDILSQFLYEAVIISFLGGIIGILIGFLMTSLISVYAEWKTVISAFSVILAFVVSVTTGIVFGIYPAKKAADKNPIDSLRYE